MVFMNSNFNFLDKFERFSIQNRLFNKGDKILVGFSGGSDSTALLLCLWHLRSKYKLTILASHVNYNLRGNDSLADEEFVKDFCFQRNISVVVKNTKIKNKKNLESQARDIRLKYFDKLSNLYKLNKIALGHNKNDQAETIIFRLLRGSGYTGLKGILPKNGKLIHPLLSFSEDEIKQYLKNEDIEWREDKTNKNNTFSRNKIRNELIPWISENMNPKITDKLYQTALIFNETDEILKERARRKLHTALIKHSKDEYKLSLKEIKNTRPIIRFYLYKEIYKLLSNSENDFYQNNFLEIEKIINAKGSKKIMLPNKITVLKEYYELIFYHTTDRKEVDINNKKEISSLRNRMTFEDYRIIMKKFKKLPNKRYLFEDKNTVYLDFDKTSFPLIIRHRLPGDKFFPLGMDHPKKIKDFFIDEKIPKFDRDKILIFCDEEKILWVSGMRIDNRVALSEKTKNILMIKIEKMSLQKARHAERINS